MTEEFQAAKDASAFRDTLLDLFSRIQHFFARLNIYTTVLPTPAMTGVIVEIVVEVLSFLAIATKITKRGRTSKLLLFVLERHLSDGLSERYLKKLIGNTDVEDALRRLDKLTQEEARMATAELLKITHNVDRTVEGMDNRMKGVDGRVQDINNNVQDIGNTLQGIGDKMHDVDDKVRGVDDRVQEVDDRVQEVGDRVQDLDDKMDQANCSSSPSSSILALNTRITGNQLRDSLRQWLSPPDPSTNYNIATDAHHIGTAQWFFQGSIFKNWQSTGSILWIHGNRTFLLPVCKPFLLIASHNFLAGSGKTIFWSVYHPHLFR